MRLTYDRISGDIKTWAFLSNCALALTALFHLNYFGNSNIRGIMGGEIDQSGFSSYRMMMAD